MRTSPRALLPLLAAALLPPPASCSFSLDTVVKDWWYAVHNHLADTTSPECLAAYAAPIDCDVTLLGLVSSGSPNFNPGPDDLARVCVPSCADSLDAWVRNVQGVCDRAGDGALLHGSGPPLPTVPVAVVGEVFQYEYAWSCSKDDGSRWCYFEYAYAKDPEYARSDFSCSNACAARFFETAHDSPGSRYWFRVYELETISSWWENQWAEGWTHLLACRDGTAPSTSAFDLTPATSTTTTRTAATETTSGAGQTLSGLPTLDPSSSSSFSAPFRPGEASSASLDSTTPTPTSTPTPTGNASGRVRAPAVFRALLWI
ncbi:hypothetical protein F4802DRAFT_336007 [Xylaria palmicola]|nr:hypothetical protein F4802DRAFT_336007 [Xylaria palmicola]